MNAYPHVATVRATDASIRTIPCRRVESNESPSGSYLSEAYEYVRVRLPIRTVIDLSEVITQITRHSGEILAGELFIQDIRNEHKYIELMTWGVTATSEGMLQEVSAGYGS